MAPAAPLRLPRRRVRPAAPALDRADFISSPFSTVYWWALYACRAGCVLVFRVGAARLAHAAARPRVTDGRPRGDRRDDRRLGGRGFTGFRSGPGSSSIWRFLDGPGGPGATRTHSRRRPERHRLRITVKDLGDGSGRLARLRPGTRVLVEGPYGRLTGERPRAARCCCGLRIGITPLRALLEDLEQRPGDVVLIYRARSDATSSSRDELDALAQAKGARLFIATGSRVPDRQSWLPADAPTSATSRGCATWCPTWTSATSTCAAARAG